MGGHAKKIMLSTLPVDAVGPTDEEEELELDDKGTLVWQSAGWYKGHTRLRNVSSLLWLML